MRLFVAMLALALSSCGDAGSQPKPRTVKRAQPPAVTSTVRLPADSGVVHVISVPGDFEVQRCLVLVPASGPTAMSCLPSVDAYLPESEQRDER